jgi:thiosulfate/3-mercaptopyruvate sulfurtransferase
VQAYPRQMDSLVSTDWLARHLSEPDLVAVDTSWHMPASGRRGHDEYLAAHIPGARFLDIDELSDRQNPAPHMLPGAEEFAAAMERLGIGSDDRIVAYDNSPIHTAARGWFMLRHFGAREVAILDGGLQKWIAEGHRTESGEPAPREACFEAHENRGELVTKQELLGGMHELVLDARGRPRFEGSEADPRPGVEPGHIPGARNLPFSALYNEDGSFKSPKEIERLFAEAGVEPTRPFVASCGSGVTANSLIFAAHLLGNDDTRLYDGSWSEWGADPATPKALGPA